MKLKKYLLGVLLLYFPAFMYAQKLQEDIFEKLNLNYPGLENVKSYCDKQDWKHAADALLEYYRERTTVKHPDINLNNMVISDEEQKWADDAMEHTFFVHKGYQPSYNYGKDINWQYWPVKDNELRWQLHRHKWFTPMGKAYRISGDEKYAKEWAYQYMDWIKKNPLTDEKLESHKLASTGEVKLDADNVQFAWRQLEVSNRLQDQTLQFLLFVPSSSFTPEFLTEFLANYNRHAEYLFSNYSKEGNHLLFEAQRMVYAGTFFPEFKRASEWRQSGIDILNREIDKQVYSDGGQYELDPHYHLAAINIFLKALRMADINGLRSEFPDKYVNTIKNMIEFYTNICFPDYTNPCFSDAKLGFRNDEVLNYKEWLEVFPDCEWIRYYATEGKEGKPLPYLSHASKVSGFFTFRNSWKEDATVMVVKAGPKGEWHCQPDNGTFELWFNGKNFFPDSGAYVYAGDDEVMKLRNWFRQTCVHNTLTLDNRNLDTTQSVTKMWKQDCDTQILVTENPHYDGLKHRRSVFFVDNSYFVLVDEAVGNATGTVNLNYQLCEGPVNIDSKTNSLVTSYEGNSQVALQCFSDKKISLEEKEGWRSTAYRYRVSRTSVSFDVDKKQKDNAVRYITIIYPFKKGNAVPSLDARFLTKEYNDNGLNIEVSVNGEKRKLNYSLK